MYLLLSVIIMSDIYGILYILLYEKLETNEWTGFRSAAAYSRREPINTTLRKNTSGENCALRQGSTQKDDKFH